MAAKGAAGLYLVGWIALAAFGLSIWRSYCEGFGCIGKGIAWAMWSGAYLVLLLVGTVAWRAFHGRIRTALRCGLIAQLALGGALLLYRVAA